ncbi:type IV toxin-antitoxin system AbiEi family antitoxin domain-containing protein, partial [bacterium]|nr:type IV toxin-antitoxin system AbiEi family antitoxin domain-containing protein [bacterium]
MNNKQFAGLSSRERKIISHFSALEKNTINTDDLVEFSSCKRTTANQTLKRLTQKGWLQRLKRGIYTIIPLSSTTATPAIENTWSL